ncbi:endonuclease NucS domain-containing protein [Nostoc sp. CMAA1605]|uniref:endonuclease NucS domain-containing protein n=1 Tax=Nostoc sp. CMAA1605 TaxID=2055159 RepID=UPI001F3455A1|nr:endonuclease NucS domain-containing protein [Nostoc sp. CMAA1605]MCF4968428.1 recombinase RecB [Nostoc sp. CMAA1605]
MTNKNVALRKTGQDWKFIDESELENFVWDNLEEIFGLKPLARQLFVKGEICDILAIGENNQLTIIELKNIEDRYVINQLTRYYETLLEEQPLKSHINYDEPIRLIAVCPSFHRHNLIDKKYSKLDFDFFTFFIKHENSDFNFHLTHILNQLEQKVIKINYQEVNFQKLIPDSIPEPPRLLLDWLGSLTQTEIENLTKIRHQILSFDSRIEEMIVNKSILYASKYGKNKIKQCAELCFDRKSKKILLFLWLTIPNRKNQTIVRMQIDTMNDYLTYWRYIPLKEGSISCKKLSFLSINYTFYSVPGNSQNFLYFNGNGNSMIRELDTNNITHLKGGELIFKESADGEIIVDSIKHIVNQALTIWLERIN